MIHIKRVYENAAKDDGYRILVDRLWPRGIKKEGSAIDLWLKEIAPSAALRKWFSHDPKKWHSFFAKYQNELKVKEAELKKIEQLEKEKGVVTLLYSARNANYNNAIVLRDVLKPR